MSVHLTQKQQEIVDINDGAVIVLAGPGSGKTRVLTERVRRLLAEPDETFRILALTFTNKAANEMVDRLQDVPGIGERAFVGTMHSFCMEILANRGKAVGIAGLPNIFESFDDRRKVLAEAIRTDSELIGLLQEAGDAGKQSKRLADWLEMIRTAKLNLQLPAMLQDDRERRIYEYYEAGLRASAAVDFDDLLLLTYRLFQERPAIADFYRRQYRYICIDEAQDLSEAQYQVLRALCGNEYQNVMVVGDPRQAIFVWSGASPHYLDLFESDFRARRIVLDENFRSSRAVVAAAQALDPDYKPEGRLPIRGVLATRAADDEDDEARWIVDRITDLVRDGHPDVEGDITVERCAVLGRNRYVFGAIERELQSRSLPYVKRLTTGALRCESDLASEWELALRLIANPADRFHLGLLAARWGITATLTELLAGTADGLALLTRCEERATSPTTPHVLAALRAADWSSPSFQFDLSLDALESAAASLPDEARAVAIADVEEWRKHWAMYVRASTNRSLPDFFAQVALGATQAARQEGLSLLSVHSAKGMEFEVVFIIGMCEGIFPDWRAAGAALEEERRNAFVAVTRSRRILHLSYPRSRDLPWGKKAQQASRYYRTVEKVTPAEGSMAENW
jgi:DNA helicase-2/ATP-dependent DNA helicase PcrA